MTRNQKNHKESLWNTKASLQSVWVCVMVSGFLNMTGMLFELWLERPIPEIPFYPAALSSAYGALVILILYLRRHSISIPLAAYLYMSNAAFVIFAFYQTNPYFLAHFAERWVPFQGNKLGTLLTPLLAPSLPSGLIVVAAYSIVSVIQFYSFPEALQQKIAYGEPSLSIVFGLAACLMLFFRFRRTQIEHRMIKAEAEAEAVKRWAHALVHLRDLTNTPLQVIEFSTALMRDHQVYDPKIFSNIEGAMRELRIIDAKLGTLYQSFEAAEAGEGPREA